MQSAAAQAPLVEALDSLWKALSYNSPDVDRGRQEAKRAATALDSLIHRWRGEGVPPELRAAGFDAIAEFVARYISANYVFAPKVRSCCRPRQRFCGSLEHF